MHRNTTRISVVAYSGQQRSRIDDTVAVEEPLEIFINDNLFHTTMRSPGEEMLLAVGYCFTRGVIRSMDDISRILSCNEQNGNRIDLFLSPSDEERMANSGKQSPPSVAYSSCGICGTDIVNDMCSSVPRKQNTLSIEGVKIASLFEVLESRQETFQVTGCAHAAGIFDRSGDLMAFAEDVGRHNALDKAVGLIVAERKHTEPCIVALTSRLSYEMIQKAARLNAEIVIGASSATSLAVESARGVNITLIGFSRKERGTIYTCPERIVLDT
ncbi:MAG: formate dehydrogenase accessory sulfurtransferase FdhD [Syntrophobacteraceae bacterium]